VQQSVATRSVFCTWYCVQLLQMARQNTKKFWTYRQRKYEIQFGVRRWAGTVGAIVADPCVMPGNCNVQRYYYFRKPPYWALWRCHSNCETELVI
jgi:hypothetical protein